MAKKLPEELEGADILPLCLASKLSDAKKIESVLDDAHIDYTFELTPITHSITNIVVGSIPNNVMFFVQSEQHELCMGLLEAAGLSSLLID
jgi:hypothetical protein